VPVGVHRMSCRMANEDGNREFAVTIEDGRETVIEYEVGSDPVVTTEP
jgi:hypothetical protein